MSDSKWWFLPCEAGSRCERLETPAVRRNEKLNLRAPNGGRPATVAGRLRCDGLLLGLPGLPLLFQRLLRRLLFRALPRVLVLGRHLPTSLWVFMCVAALPRASSRLHLRRLPPRSVQGLRRS